MPARSTAENLYGFFKAQTTYKAPIAPAAADAFRATNIMITPQHDRPMVDDEYNTRSRQVTFEGSKRADVSVETLLRPSGTAGTPPEVDKLLKHVMGIKDVTATTSVAYTLARDMSALFGSLFKHEGLGHEAAHGVMFNRMEVRWGYNQPAQMTFSGMARRSGKFAPALTSAAGVTSTVLNYDTEDDNIGYGTLVKIGTNASVLVTSVTDPDTVVIATSQGWANNAAITDGLPDPTMGGTTPVFGTTGELSFDGGTTNILHMSGSLSLENGASLYDMDFGDDGPSDVVNSAFRSVQLSLELTLDDTNTHLLNAARRKGTHDIEVQMGSAAGHRLTISAPLFEPAPPPVSTPNEGLETFTLSGPCLASSAGEDELELIFT